MSQLTDAIEEVYRRIEAHADNPVFIHVLPKVKALERAREVEKLPRELPLWGRTFAVKDNIDVAGLPTTAGCPAAAWRPERTAAAVEKALAAGAILIGKANMDAFAIGFTGMRSPYGACRNAFDPDYVSGGSSSGPAVAVALGMASFALGTDTAGSGRVPAALNGLVAIKPTHGLVSTRGVMPSRRSFDCVSVLALSCTEAQDVLRVLQGPDAEDAYSRTGAQVALPADKFRFGVPAADALEFYGDSEYAKLFAQAMVKLRQLGGTPVEIDFRPFREARRMLHGPLLAERLAALETFLPHMPPATRERIEAGRKYSAVELAQAQHRLAELRAQCAATFRVIDVLLVPGTPTVYKRKEIEADAAGELDRRLGRYASFANPLGLAAIVLPAGQRPDGLPFGISLVGPAFSDDSLLSLGKRFLGEKGH